MQLPLENERGLRCGTNLADNLGQRMVFRAFLPSANSWGSDEAATGGRMPGLCQRAWLLLVLLVALLTWHIRPQHGRVVIDTQPSRDHAIAARTPGAPALPRSQPQQHDSAPEPRAAPEQLPEWAVDHEPRTRSLLRLYPRLAATRSQRLRSVPSIDALGGCPGNCSGHGQCQSQRGTVGVWSTRCACAPGWNGTACEVRDASPCNTPHGGRVLSRCAARCQASQLVSPSVTTTLLAGSSWPTHLLARVTVGISDL